MSKGSSELSRLPFTRMSRSSRHKSEFPQKHDNEDSSARTRPFSYDDIMLRRKSKMVSQDVKEEIVEAGKSVGAGIVEDVSNCYKSQEMDHSHLKNSSHVVKRLSSEICARGESKRIAENISTRKDRKGEKKNREGLLSEVKTKAAIKKYMSVETKSLTDERSLSRKMDNRTKDVLENEIEKKHIRANNPSNRNTTKSEIECERKYKHNDEKYKSRESSKKHGLNRGCHKEVPERRERKEPKVDNPKTGERRRRSRSLDHKKDKNQRSILPSPSANRHSSSHQQRQAELTSHALHVRFRRHHLDIRSSRIENNSSSSHSRRLSGATSGLGGYSPRKRRAEDSVNNPPNHSPEKKPAQGDPTPIERDAGLNGFDSSVIQSETYTASSNIHEGVSTAVKLPVEVSYGVLSPMQDASTDSVQLTEATRPMRRLYVDNVPDSVSEKSLMDAFNNLLISSGFSRIQGSQPCISCAIHGEKGQALLEFLTPEDASSAFFFDGYSFSGFLLKIRRPKEFVEVIPGELEKSVTAVRAITDVVKDSPYKIFVGGIPSGLSSQMLMDIVTSFGPLKTYRFVTNEDPRKSYAFLEYVDRSLTLKACAGLNGMRLGGNEITVVPAFLDSQILEYNEDPPFYGIPEHAKSLFGKPTEVLKLKNVLNPGILLLSRDEVEDILEDLRLECARFGSVKSINFLGTGINTTLDACVQEIRRNGYDEEMIQTDSFEGCQHTSVKQSPSNNKVDQRADILEVNDSTDDLPPSKAGKSGLDQICTKTVFEESNHNGMAAMSEQFLDQPKTIKAEPEGHSEKLAVDIKNKDFKVENKSEAGIELNPDDVTRALLVNSTGEVCTTSMLPSDIMIDDKKQQSSCEHLFESGAVFIEFGRIEVSSTAAHCLHGRLFDNKIVTVEYVPLDHYRAKFLK